MSAPTVTWASLDDLKVVLGIADTDVAQDELLTVELQVSNAWAFRSRADTGLYPADDPAVAPDAAVTGGVIAYCLRRLRDRGFAAVGAGMGDTFDPPAMGVVNSELGLGGGWFA